VADDPTTGEVYRRLQDHEQRTALEHRAIDDRITRASSEAVQADVYARAERDRDRELRQLEGRLEKLEARPGLTWGRVVAGATVVAGLLAVLLQAYATVKGAK
jgi:hypothetical protein